MKKYGSIIGIGFLFLSILLGPSAAHAETHVSGDLDGGGIPIEWTKSGSPYIIDDTTYVYSGDLLLIQAGVRVQSGASADGSDVSKTLIIKGGLEIAGTAEEPVVIEGLADLHVEKNQVFINHTIFRNNKIGLSAKGSHVSIAGASFEENDTGIKSDKLPPLPVLAVADGLDKIDESNGTGGIGNALDAMESLNTLAYADARQNQISVNDSSFVGNRLFAINNVTVNSIDAADNWWGSPTGPGTTINGLVDAEPWKTSPPTIISLCCSNVLFLPGIEASRLYRDQSGMLGSIFGTTTNRLWEPNRNYDVRKLFMNISGSSTDPTVYPQDVIDSVFGFGIYKKFIAMMDGMVADKKIKQWLPFPYDWRNDARDVVTLTGLVNTVENLAATSPTGKVTIVAHSNGGIVAKALGVELEKIGKADLIDRVLFVAVPQLGTPQAIAGLLHGDGQSIAGGLFLKQGVARTFGLNMPGAYGLLPSLEYFKRAHVSPIGLGTSTIGISGTASAYDSFANFVAFLKGIIKPRTQPSESDTKSLAVANANILERALDLHNLIDNWRFPTSTQVFSLIGWGKPTTQSIDYSGKDLSKDSFIRKSQFGDGTVAIDAAEGYASSGYGSSTSNAENNFYFDQASSNKTLKEKISHSNMLESKSVESLISNLVATTSPLNSPGAELPTFISSNRPIQNQDSIIVVGIHSPVDVDVYDDHGGHLGFIPNPFPDSDLDYLENTLDDATYEHFGDLKYVYLSSDNVYTVKLKGTGSGTFTYTVDETIDGEVVASSTFVDLPVTPLLVATSTVMSRINPMGGNSNGISTLPTLALDVDGDGTLDITTKPSAEMDPLVHIDAIKVLIGSLNLNPAAEKNMLQRVEHIRKLIEKGRKGKAIKRLKKAEAVVGNIHWSKNKLTKTDREQLAAMIEQLLSGLESDY